MHAPFHPFKSLSNYRQALRGVSHGIPVIFCLPKKGIIPLHSFVVNVKLGLRTLLLTK